MEMDDDEGCVAMSVYLMSLNCTLKMVRFMSRIFYHTHTHTHKAFTTAEANMENEQCY